MVFLLLHTCTYSYARWEINQFKMRKTRGERAKKKNVYTPILVYPRSDHRNFDRQFPHTRICTPTHCWIMLIKIGLPLFPINYHICIIWVKRIKQFNAIHRAGILCTVVVVFVSRGEGEGLIIIYTVSGRVTVYGLFS